jgi:hypothetical protein
VSALTDGRQSLEIDDRVEFELASNLRNKRICAAEVRVIN